MWASLHVSIHFVRAGSWQSVLCSAVEACASLNTVFSEKPQSCQCENADLISDLADFVGFTVLGLDVLCPMAWLDFIYFICTPHILVSAIFTISIVVHIIPVLDFASIYLWVTCNRFLEAHEVQRQCPFCAVLLVNTIDLHDSKS